MRNHPSGTGARTCPRAVDAPAWLQGEGDAVWRVEFERHVQACPACADRLATYRRILDGLRSAPDADAAGVVAARVMERVRHEAASDRGPARIVDWMPRLARAAAAVLLLGGAAWGLFALRAIRPPEAGPWTAEPPEGGTAQWLIAAQRSDGGWNAAAENFEVGVSAAAILALLRAGDGASTKARDGAIRNGMMFLLAAQNDTGFFGVEFSAATYNHGLATLAALEAADRTGDPAWAAAAGRGVRRLAAMQDASGGWGYVRARPGDANTSASVWPILALIRAADRGYDDLRPAIDRGLDWLLSTVDPTGFMGYRHAGDASEAGETTTAAGIVCLVHGGRDGGDPVVRTMVDLLRDRNAQRDPAADVYRDFFLAEAFALAGGPAPPAAGNSASIKGARIHAPPTVDPSGDRWSSVGGPVYAAAFTTLAAGPDRTPEPGRPRGGG